MSDHIPLDIQIEIIKILAVKYLIKFRSVSKTWKSLIDSPEFCHIQMHRLLVEYRRPSSYYNVYVTFVDDDDTFLFDQNIVPVFPGEPHIFRILGSSHGLFCLHCIYHDAYYDPVKEMFIIWNPSIRKSVDIKENKTFSDYYSNISEVYFGVCPVTRDPKLVRITFEDLNWLVEIYTLSSGSWRKIFNNLPRGTIELRLDHVVTDGFIYWDACDLTIDANGSVNTVYLIVSFDLTSEEFTLTDIPDCLALADMSISKLSDSLVLLQYDLTAEKPVCVVWMMNNGMSKTFTKLFNINASNLLRWRVKGFTKSGTPIVRMGDYGISDGLYVFQPNLERISKIEIEEVWRSLDVFTYHETLLLLDR